MIPLRRSCREVTRIVLEGQERDLSVLERVILRLHWAACDGCSRFRKQVQFMRSAMGRWRAYADQQPGEP
jgi:hypothetical protein